MNVLGGRSDTMTACYFQNSSLLVESAGALKILQRGRANRPLSDKKTIFTECVDE